MRTPELAPQIHPNRVFVFGRSVFVLFFLWLTTISAPTAAQVADRRLDWNQIETEHFVVAYHEPLGLLARRAAAALEQANSRVSAVLDHELSGTVYVVLTDGTDSANGSATSLPYNTLRLFASAPEDLTPLGDVDDWFHILTTHEHTHVLHLDTVGGLPQIVNSVLGKVMAPNVIQPRWFIEGLATHMESREGSAGRLRSTMFDMYLRMDALEGRLLRLDQVSNGVDRWPHGNVYYLYGSHFVDWIAEHYGREALTQISHEYGRGLVPYALNRVAQHATGATFDALYERWLARERQIAWAQRRQIQRSGIAAGTRLTRHGEIARSPRWVDNEHIAYFARIRGQDSQIRQIDRDGANPTELTRVQGTAYFSNVPSEGPGEFIYNGLDALRDIYTLNDLFWRHADGTTTRLSVGLRAQAPDVHGRRVVFTQNGAGTTHLMIAEIDAVEDSKRVLLRNPRFAQVYTPRFSPDGLTVAISRWERGRRDIQLVDVATGEVRAVTDDRAMDTGPAWSPDGRFLYFSSDRTGVANIYRYELTTEQLVQVTNVVAGAYAPDVAPDGRSLVYLGYTSIGWDLWRFELEAFTPREAIPYVDDRAPVPEAEYLTTVSSRYEAWRTLIPRSYFLDVQNDTFGTQLGVLVSQRDVAGHYEYAARIGIGLTTGYVNLEAAFAFQQLPAPIRLSAFRQISRRGGLEVAGEERSWTEEAVGGNISIRYALPRAFHSESIHASYALTWLRQFEPFGGRLDPNTPPPVFPTIGRVARLRAGYLYSDVRTRPYDMTPSAGRSINLDLSVAHPVLGSEFRSVSFRWTWRQYISLPWAEHHTLAIRYGGGLSAGDLGRRGLFSAGGFPQASLVDGFTQGALGGVALRGYPSGSRVGTQLHQIQLEYRLPLVRLMSGYSTLPLFLRRMHASIFVDAGDAFFGTLDPETFRVGVGAELFTDIGVAYVLSFKLRLGFAYGLMEGGGPQVYFHLGAPF